MWTVGYGDIYPVCNNEKIYGMVAMLIAWGFFAHLIGSIGSIVNKSNIMTTEYKHKMTHIKQFLIYKSIPNQMKNSIMSYLEYMWDYKQQYKLDEREVLEMLNDGLRDQVIVYLNGRILQNCTVFKHFSMNLLSELTFLLESITFALDDNIFEESSIGDKLYFITKGNVVLFHKKTKTFVKEIEVDEYFGEVSFFSGFKRSVTATAKTFCEMMFLSFNSFQEVINSKPAWKAMYEAIKTQIWNKGDLSPIGVVWFICGQLGHISINWNEFWKIEGNVKHQLKRLRSITERKIKIGCIDEDAQNKLVRRFLHII